MTRWQFQLVVYFVCLVPPVAHGQYLGRNSVQLPSIGWMGLDSSFGPLNDSLLGIKDQVQIGTGYARDLSGLKLWWHTQTALGFAQIDREETPKSRIAVTLHASTGLKYNLLNEYWRPFTGFMVGIFQIFNFQQNVLFYGDYSSPIWAALSPLVGVEWIFSTDMSIEIEASYVLLNNLEDPLRHSAMTRFAYRTYF